MNSALFDTEPHLSWL